MCRNKCILQSIKEYYGAICPNPILTCAKKIPSCRGESARVVKPLVLIGHLEAGVFDDGYVTLGIFASKILAKKGRIWVEKAVDVKSSDAHEINILL